MTRIAPRGGVGASDLPADTTYVTSPPSSTYHYGGPTINGSRGGFISVVTIGGIIVILVGLGVWFFLRRRRTRQLVASSTSRRVSGGAGATAAGAAATAAARTGSQEWRRVNRDDFDDDDDDQDPFELPQTLAFDPSRLDLRHDGASTADLEAGNSIRDPFSDDKTPYYNPSAVAFDTYNDEDERHETKNPFADVHDETRPKQ